MTYRNLADAKAYAKRHYLQNKPTYKARARKNNRKYRAVARNWVKNYKLSHPCIKCGESDPVCLDFHHARGGKEITLAHSVRNGWTIKRMKVEIEKCDVLCANCHRKEHRTNMR